MNKLCGLCGLVFNWCGNPQDLANLAFKNAYTDHGSSDGTCVSLSIPSGTIEEMRNKWRNPASPSSYPSCTVWRNGLNLPSLTYSYQMFTLEGSREVFVAASTRCFMDKTFDEACGLLTDLEYDKVEIWMNEKSDHLKPSEVAEDPDRFFAHYRETTRLTPVAICLEHDVTTEVLQGLTKLCKLMKITQLTIPASPIGTPFNEEIDRLRAFLKIANHDGIRLSLKTQTGLLTEDPHTAVELCQSVKGLGLTLDPSYYICGPNRGITFDQVYPYVYHVHLRDTTPDQVQVQIGLGEIDYNRMISSLDRENYKRSLSVDLHCDAMDDESRPLEMRKLRMLLETLL